MLEKYGFIKTAERHWTRRTRLPDGSLVEDQWNEGENMVLRIFTPATPAPKWVTIDAVIGEDPRQLKLFK